MKKLILGGNMKVKVILSALVMVAVSSAQAGKGEKDKMDPVGGGAKPAVKASDKAVEATGAKLGLSTSSINSIKAMDEVLKEAAGKAKNMSAGSTDANIAHSFVENINKNVKEKNMHDFAIRLVDFLAAYGKGASEKNMTFMAKLMDLASRPNIASSEKYQKMLRDIVKDMAETKDLDQAITKNVTAGKVQSIIDCE